MALVPSVCSALRERGISVRETWVGACVDFLETEEEEEEEGVMAPSSRPDRRRLVDRVCLHFLHTDIRDAAVPCLPPDIGRWEKRVLAGCHVLQIEDIANIAQPREGRFADTPPRTLRLTLTDGRIRVVGLEDTPLLAFRVGDEVEGAKVLVKDIPVRHGVLLMRSSTARILGGGVEELKTAARAKREALTQRTRGRPAQQQTYTAIEGDDALFAQVELPQIPSTMQSDAERPWTVLARVCTNDELSIQQSFRVHARISEIVGRLDFKGTYSLDVRIEDGTSTLCVRMANSLVESLVGVPASDLWKTWQSKETAHKEEVKKRLSRFQSRLTSLMGVMHLRRGDDDTIVMDSVQPPTRDDAHNLLDHVRGHVCWNVPIPQ